MTTTCPTCRRPFPPPEPTEERPFPLEDHRAELLQRLAGDGRLTANILAGHLYGPDPTPSQVERARMVLHRAVKGGTLWLDTSEKEHVYRLPSSTRTRIRELLTLTTALTARSAACHLFDTDRPRPSEIEMARRRLEALVTDGYAVKRTKSTGETSYHLLTPPRPATG